MKLPRRVIVGIALLATVAGSIVASSAPAYAASCSGAGCMGMDPYNAGCSATSTRSTTYQSGSAVATLVNEYSYSCNANWSVAYENSAAETAGWQLYTYISTYWTKTVNHVTLSYSEFTCTPNNGKGVNSYWSGNEYIQDETCTGPYGGKYGWPIWTDMVNGQYLTTATMAIYIPSIDGYHFYSVNQ